MVIFRENTEDIYAGIEWAAGSPEVAKVIAFLRDEMKVKKIRFPESSGIGLKPMSREGTERLVRAAIRYAIENKRKSVTLVHKGNIMKFTEGAFRDWGYALAAKEFRDHVVTERESWILGNKEKDAGPLRGGQRQGHRARLRPHDRRPEGQGPRRKSRRGSRSCPATAAGSGSRRSCSATPSPTSRCSRC